MLKEQLPLVSCIMPTYNRRQFVPLALKYFLRQDYENKELIIIDDGDDAVEDIIPLYNQIKYYRLPNKISLGAKLNRGCEHASGDIIVNWDDDDWYSSRRLSYLVEQFQSHETEVCGINQLFYFDIGTKKAFQYRYPDTERKWLLGSSLCYKRKYWQTNRFANVNVGMDALFVWKAEPQKVKVLPDPTIAVHLIHSNNVSAKKTEGEWWHSYPVEELKKILDEDWHHYSNGLLQEKDRSTISFNTEKIVTENPKTIQNIFACLVHDYEDCVIDLVRNLHYHDPSSIIILYNGGNNPNLIKKKFPFDKFNAVVHPKPSPVKHGYLHQYALNCMQFALQNFNFDTFTIVDSDQLAIRFGYTKYLDESVASFSNIGLFSCRPQRVSPNEKDIRVWPAVQAFKEFDLWKPLLQTFDNGEEKFVHWTFWPSTVFTKNAICDLLKLFRENKLLQSIMSRSGMWAAEEVVFPTLIKLLGYEIALNPCADDYVKYQASFGVHHLQEALRNQDVFWMHPVQRNYNNPIRNYIRMKNDHYAIAAEIADIPSTGSFFLSILNRVHSIEGWLSDEEANLLMETTLKACIQTSAQAIVEVGSYHGKSTVLLGAVVKEYFNSIKVYAIDPHEGVIGAADQGLQTLPQSLDMFNKNIKDAGLSDVIELIKECSYNVVWERPVSLLFIDGIHDYPNVSRDFWHFSEWIVKGGFVAFHDYAHYYPGVITFVNEMIQSKEYKLYKKADTLIVLQKE